MDVRQTQGWVMQPSDIGNHWLPCGPRAAAYWSSAGVTVRLVDQVERAIQHARTELGVLPWVVRQGLRKAGGTQARALVCLCLRRVGWSQRQIAASLNLSQASVSDLIKKWAGEREVKEALEHWPATPTPVTETPLCDSTP